MRAARLTSATRALVPEARAAAEDDWGREYLDRILAVRVVDGIDGALEHVARYGSRHTEAICTRDEAHAARWRSEVDAACVVVNASTRFHDGGELGLGAEIGIATSKLHWRGAMGLEALTTFQWVVEGDGQTRDRLAREETRLTTKKRAGTGSGEGGRPRIKSSHERVLEGSAGEAQEEGVAGRTARRRERRARPPSTAGGTCARRGPGTTSAQPDRSGAWSMATDSARDTATAIAVAALDKKAVGLEILDVAGKVDYADFLVIMTGRSDRHAQALAQGIEEALKKQGVRPVAVEGLPHGRWVLMDFGDVVVHVFQDEARQLYDLDGPLARRAPSACPVEAARRGAAPRVRDSQANHGLGTLPPPPRDVVLEVELPPGARAGHRAHRAEDGALGPRAVVQAEAPRDVRVTVGIAAVERPPVVQVDDGRVRVLRAAHPRERQLAPEHARIRLDRRRARGARSSPRSRARRAIRAASRSSSDRST